MALNLTEWNRRPRK